MIYNSKGQILPFLIIVLSVVLTGVLLTTAGSRLYYQTSTYSVSSEAALSLAEAGVDKAIASLNKAGGAYTGEVETSLGEGSYSVAVTTKDSATKIITSTGFIPNKANPKVKRTTSVQLSQGVGVSFVYGIQIGEGGLELGNANEVVGSVYSNGNITMGNSNEISGDVWVAGGPQATSDQQTDCNGSNCQDYQFGKSISGENRLDIAQSFKSSQQAVLNKISLKIKKIGNPADVTVRILGNSGTSPNKNAVITSGTLYSSLVTSSYGWIDVTFSSTPALTAETTYWIVLDTSSNNSNYWSWQNDLAQSYNRGNPKFSPNWSASSPVWNPFSGDLSFKTYLGGVPTSISGGNSGSVGGDVHANTINHLNIEKDAYFQTITLSSVGGHQFPGSSDPPPKVFPISEGNILDWKQQAQSSGVTNGNISSCVSTLGPGKINGNVTFGNACNVTIKSPVWITGNLTLGNSNKLKLSPEFGSTSGVIIVDGVTNFTNSNELSGSGAGSILMLLSTYDSRTNGLTAVNVGNSGNTGVLYADKGILTIGNSNDFKELTAWKIKLINSTTINYVTGLASTLFSAGPTGSYSLIKGTYKVE